MPPSASPGNVALYYPYIHFRSDSWLKAAALYWPRISRIVPHEYPLHDSAATWALRDAGLIDELRPDYAAYKVARRFLALIDRNGPALSRRLGMRDFIAEHGSVVHEEFHDDRVAFVEASKLSEPLIAALQEYDLGVRIRGQQWVGMHPDLTQVYMCALTAELSSEYGLSPVTDQSGPFVATGGWPLERVAAVLLADPSLATGPAVAVNATGAPRLVAPEALYDRFMIAALQSVVPGDLSRVSMETVLRVRAESFHLFADYRDFVSGLVTELLASRDPQAQVLDADIAAEIDLKVKPKLQALELELSSHRLRSAQSLITLNTILPAGLALEAAQFGNLPPTVQVGATVAWGVGTLGLEHRRATGAQGTAVVGSPVGYLHHVRSGLRPASTVSRLLRMLRPGQGADD